MASPTPKLWDTYTAEQKDLYLFDHVNGLETRVAELQTWKEDQQDKNTAAETQEKEAERKRLLRRSTWDKRLTSLQAILLVALPILVTVFVSSHGTAPVILQYGLIAVGVLVVVVLAIRLISP